jgi:hypothetical protein
MTHGVSNSHNCICKHMLIWQDIVLMMELDVTQQISWLGVSFSTYCIPQCFQATFGVPLLFWSHVDNSAATQVTIWWYVQWWCWGAVMMQGRWQPPCVPRATWTTTLRCLLLALRSEAACWHHTSLLVEPSMTSNTSRWRLTCCAVLGSCVTVAAPPFDLALLSQSLTAAIRLTSGKC